MRGPARDSRQVMQAVLWCSGLTKSEVGRRLYVSASTVSTSITRLRDHYGEQGRPAHSQALLLIRLLEDGLVTLPEVSRLSAEVAA